MLSLEFLYVVFFDVTAKIGVVYQGYLSGYLICACNSSHNDTGTGPNYFISGNLEC